ncbi:Hypothetical protein PHPALM_6870 [Phytophthora palmivora]|uniref:Uncharacterized protein n=1 Tax=Phytophthora palmivora TaxID=4796 RepID=A0A2P4YDT7_9STRA|nr:Hypothetical protein PHPALM_6870 [Phytophthora palmivora]
MSSTPEETQQEQEQCPSPQEKHTQDTETEEGTTKGEEQKPEEVKTPAKAATAPTSASKRKVDALHAGNTTEPEKKKPRVKTSKPSGSTKKAPTKTKEFSFARPTASSASRTAAAARDHAQAKTKPTPPPTRKPLYPKRTPAKVERPAPKTPVSDKASRPHFNYTPYTGPLPPLTVESSFAPKNSQNLERPRHATPAKKTTRKLVATPGKENNGINTKEDAATNAASSSKTSRTPIKSSKTGSPLNERTSPVSTSAAIVEPTA